MAVYFFHGDEDFLIEAEVNKLKKGLDKNFLDMSFKTYDNPKFPDLISVLRSQPMMFGKMLIVINCLDYFSKTLEDKQLKEIEKAIENCSENLDIVFVAALPRDGSKKLDSRKKIFKIFAKNGAQECASIPSYKTAEIEDWIRKQAKSKSLKIDNGAVSTLVTQVGNNLRQLDGELEKLHLICYPDKIASKENVKEICISNEDLFAFSDFLMRGEKDRALLEYRKLIEKKYPLEILSVLQTMLRRWIFIKAKASELSASEIGKHLGLHEYVVKLSIQKLKNTNLKALVKLKQNLTDAEFKIKTGRSGELEREVENAFFN